MRASMEREQFVVAFEKYYKSLFRCAYRMTGSFDDAEEIVQEAFLKAWRSRNRFRYDCALKTWLYQIVINTARSWKRHLFRRRRKMNSYSLFKQFLPSTRDPEEEFEKIEMQQRMNEALSALPGEMRALIVLRDFESLPYDEIATILDVPIGTVKSRIWRARSALKKEFVKQSVLQTGFVEKNREVLS